MMFYISSIGIKNTKTNKDVSVEDAVRTGILDVPSCSYMDLKDRRASPIPDAVDADLIEADTAKKIYNAMGNSSLSKSLLRSFEKGHHLQKYTLRKVL